jgi:hypothetical protein
MILRLCATSSIVDIQVNPNGCEECTDPESRNRLNEGGKGNKRKEQTLARSIVSRASFLRRSRLSTLVSEAPATPPPPNFEPTRF